MSKCVKCGKYNDRFEWPPDQVDQFRPDLCYDCYQAELEESDEVEDFDPNTEFGMPEVKPDPEDDDTPDLGESDISDEPEDQTNEQPPTTSEDDDSIRRLRDMLFG